MVGFEQWTFNIRSNHSIIRIAVNGAVNLVGRHSMIAVYGFSTTIPLFIMSIKRLQD